MPIDIDKSHYSTGLASVTQGTKTVLGAGTVWSQAIRRGDLFGTHVGLAVRIAEVVSDGELTLAYDWPGPNQVSAPYEIQLTGDEIRYQQAVRELLSRLASGNLEALAALVGEADKVPVFTGPGAMDLLDVGVLSGGGGAWDVVVDNLAGRDDYDDEDDGFRVLVKDAGNGRAAVYELQSGNWVGPIYFTGPAGQQGPGDVFALAFGVAGRPFQAEVLPPFTFVDSITFPTNFTGSQAKAGIGPAATALFSIRKNGEQVGTLTFSAGATTGTFASGGPVSFSAGDVLTIVCPNPRDTTLSDIAGTLRASLT